MLSTKSKGKIHLCTIQITHLCHPSNRIFKPHSLIYGVHFVSHRQLTPFSQIHTTYQFSNGAIHALHILLERPFPKDWGRWVFVDSICVFLYVSFDYAFVKNALVCCEWVCGYDAFNQRAQSKMHLHFEGFAKSNRSAALGNIADADIDSIYAFGGIRKKMCYKLWIDCSKGSLI